MRKPWRCLQCPALVESSDRTEHLWQAHLIKIIDGILNRFFSPAWN
jgi:hypothetical protein